MSISAAEYTGTELSKQGANHSSAIVTGLSLAMGNPRSVICKLQMEILILTVLSYS